MPGLLYSFAPRTASGTSTKLISGYVGRDGLSRITSAGAVPDDGV